jgi:hypothetical protein
MAAAAAAAAAAQAEVLRLLEEDKVMRAYAALKALETAHDTLSALAALVAEDTPEARLRRWLATTFTLHPKLSQGKL